MAVNIELTYGKKLGLPEYSSHNFNVSVKCEVASLADVPAEVEKVYGILQDSVDSQIVNPGFVPGAKTESNSRDIPKQWKCSDKQKELILKIVEERKLDRKDVEDLAVKRFDHGVTALNKLEASGLIDELLGSSGHNSRRRGSNTQNMKVAA